MQTLQFMNDPQPWRTLATRTAFKNRWLTVETDDVQLPSGQQYEYTRLVGPGIGVAVIGFNAAGEILLEREYRHGVGEVIWQLPGGLIHEGEELIIGGLRELEEETGFAPAQVTSESVRYLGAVWDNPGFGNMTSHIVAAWGLEHTGNTHLDPTEFVSLHWVTMDWLKEAVRSGEVKERTTVAALAYLMLLETL